MFLGPLRLPDAPGAARRLSRQSDHLFDDLRASETASVLPLLALAVLIGVAPRFLLDVIEPASSTLINLVSR